MARVQASRAQHTDITLVQEDTCTSTTESYTVKPGLVLHAALALKLQIPLRGLKATLAVERQHSALCAQRFRGHHHWPTAQIPGCTMTVLKAAHTTHSGFFLLPSASKWRFLQYFWAFLDSCHAGKYSKQIFQPPHKKLPSAPTLTSIRFLFHIVWVFITVMGVYYS